MHRIDESGHVDNRFSLGNPATGTPATILGADWPNAVQEEIMAVLVQAGISPVKGTNTQLRDSIMAIANAAASALIPPVVVRLEDNIHDPDYIGESVILGGTAARKVPAVKLANGAEDALIGLAVLPSRFFAYQLTLVFRQGTAEADKAVRFTCSLFCPDDGQTPEDTASDVSASIDVPSASHAAQQTYTSASWKIPAASLHGDHPLLRVRIAREGAPANDNHGGDTYIYAAYLTAVAS